MTTTDDTPTTTYDPETERETPPVTDLTTTRYLMSLTGFDEIAVAARFGEKLQTIRADGINLGRALVFVDYRRQGLNDKDAHDAALGLTIRQVLDYFPPEPKDDDTPASAEGN